MAREEPAESTLFLAWGMSSSVPGDPGWLTPAEQVTLGRMVIPKRASDWRLGRWIGKQAVRRALGVPDLEGTEVEILASPRGAPEVRILAPGPWPEVGLSLSHAWGMGFAAALPGSARVGCDVEAVRPRSDAFVSDYFTVREADMVRRAEADDRAAWANLLWSAKESALKALGEGLRLDTRSVQVTVREMPAVDGWCPLSVATPVGEALEGRWRVTGGFVWTLVADVPLQRIDGTPGG